LQFVTVMREGRRRRRHHHHVYVVELSDGV